MRKLKVQIIDQLTLKLLENGLQGDIIDLKELHSVDDTAIFDAITQKRDEIYTKMLQDEIAKQDLIKQNALSHNDGEHASIVSILNNEKERLAQTIDALKREIEFEKQKSFDEALRQKNLEIKKIQDEYQKTFIAKEIEIAKLIDSIESIRTNQELLIEKEKRTQESVFGDTIVKKEREIESLKLDYEKRIGNLELEAEKSKKTGVEMLSNKKTEIDLLNQRLTSKDDELKLLIENEKIKVESKYKEQLAEKEQQLSQLQMMKSNLQIKMLGEELEKWCTSEYESYAINGFKECNWEKDNKVVTEAGEEKGSKADYIFRVYADESKKSDQLLMSVCLEMKNESPTSSIKHKNFEYYKKLDKDRDLKKCQYSLLVSELEWDSVNDSPIKKVNEYSNMYVVRPTYFITFLSLISSLAKKYQSLLLAEREEYETLSSSREIFESFEQFKITYLDKPINALKKQIEVISKNADSIFDASQKIQQAVNEITYHSIQAMHDKIDTFEIKNRTLTNKIKILEKM